MIGYPSSGCTCPYPRAYIGQIPLIQHPLGDGLFILPKFDAPGIVRALRDAVASSPPHALVGQFRIFSPNVGRDTNADHLNWNPRTFIGGNGWPTSTVS